VKLMTKGRNGNKIVDEVSVILNITKTDSKS
jgi:hypothetical protein